MNNTFSHHITSDLIDFKYAKGASDRSGKEFHSFHEIIYLIDGEVEFISDNIHTQLESGCLVVIPKNSYHQFIIKGNQNQYHRCVFNFFDIDELVPLIEQKLTGVYICNLDKNQKYLMDKMITLNTSNMDKKALCSIARSALTLLLTELSFIDRLSPASQLSAATQNAVELINKRLCENISVSDLAQNLNVSVSGLAHTFKSEMHISIYKYILKKRLQLAHEKLLQGKPSTLVASECGFYDYSGFYKVYKKEFGTPPSYTIR